MESTIRDLLARLHRSDALDDAGVALLESLLDVCQQTPGLDRAPLRALLHFRSGGGYDGLVVSQRRDADAAPLAQSAALWELVEAHRQPMVVDLLQARARVVGAPSAEPLVLRQSRSVIQMRERVTAALLLLPMRGAGGRLWGMVSAEVGASARRPDPADLDALAERLQLLVDVATPPLVSLPHRAPPPATGDRLLPVVGARMGALVRLLGVFARQDETLLLSGPTGVGKSRLAAWCHAQSASSAGPFEAVHLISLPEEMQLASLFGWRRGAFTGAVRDTPGSVERARGGTLFIDEIDKLSLEAQSGLLRLLETGRYRVVGDPGPERTAEVRFVVGTNADLQAAIAEGRFLEDLYYRINVLPVRVPPLAERRDEIPDWVAFMLARRHRKAGRAGRIQLSPGAAALLAAREWPGNLRQLDNVVRRTYAIAAAMTPEGGVVVERAHAERALGMERARPRADRPEGLLPRMRAAGEAFAREAEQRGELDLGFADTFGTVALLAALELQGDLKEAFRLVGRGRLVETRNHTRELRRRLERLRALYEHLGEPFEEPDL